MPVTRVIAKHLHGPHENGVDGCHARWGNSGMCPGVRTAAWLNSLGDDDAMYTTRHTNLQVRLNYLKSHDHVVAAEPRLAELLAIRERYRKELRYVGRQILEARKAGKS